ncbi:hypothetical protein SARC_05529, partial [Sphaeroforma arctica JP610]
FNMEKAKAFDLPNNGGKIGLEEDSALAVDIDDPRQDDAVQSSSGQSHGKSPKELEKPSPARKHNVLESHKGDDDDNEPWEESPLTAARWYQKLLFSQVC